MTASGNSAILQLENVSRTYVGRRSVVQWLTRQAVLTHAVRGVSFSLTQGSVLGIIGESGSGKSTLGYVMANLDQPSSGRILFRGRPLDDMRPSERRVLRRKVQVIFQDSMASLNPRRRVIWAIMDALRLAGVPTGEVDNRIEKLVRLVSLSKTHLHHYPHELSGGQRQRIGIARALAMDPEIVIADEPVSALDVSLQGQIINLLIELKTTLGLTIVLISHDLAVVRNVCDTTAVMFGGRIVEYGSTEQVVENPQHPYTQELIAAVPKGVSGKMISKEEKQSADEFVLAGDACCPYSDRCSKVMAICRQALPQRIPLMTNHWAACHLHGRLHTQ